MGSRELEDAEDDYYDLNTELSTHDLNDEQVVYYGKPVIEAETCLGTPVHPDESAEFYSESGEQDFTSNSVLSDADNAQVSDTSQWINANSTILFSLGCVKKYFLSPKGVVETSVKEETLKIFQLKQKVEIEGVLMPDVFLQIGDWYYPLVPNVSPFLKDGHGAYLFPDIRNPGSSVAVTLPWQTAECFYTVLQAILFPEENDKNEDDESEEKEPEPEQPPAEEKDDVDDMCMVLAPTVDGVARSITTGAAFISHSLVSAAEKASRVMYDLTPKIIDNLGERQTVHVNTSLSRGVEDAAKVCQQAAMVTGYVSTQLGQATAALGEFLARRPGTYLTSNAGATQGVSDTVQILSGAAEGMAIVYSGLQRFSSILATSLADNTVKVVGHKYGPEVGQVTRSTLNFLGSLLQTASNMKIISPRTTVRRVIHEVGKATTLNLPQITEK